MATWKYVNLEVWSSMAIIKKEEEETPTLI